MMNAYGPGMGYGMMGGWLGWLVMLFFGLLVFAGVVLLVIWTVRASLGTDASAATQVPRVTLGHDEAVAIARKRLASGEITKEQYDEIMHALGGDG